MIHGTTRHPEKPDWERSDYRCPWLAGRVFGYQSLSVQDMQEVNRIPVFRTLLSRDSIMAPIPAPHRPTHFRHVNPGT